jgi:hypothetical protein
MTVAERIQDLDVSLFDTVKAQLGPADRQSLLSLHATWREIYEQFDYLEIGSYLGGSLQAFVQDPACRTVISIDSRPADQPDLRGFRWQYPENTTERMLEELRRLPEADLSKVISIDASTEALDPRELHPSPQVCFIDGEHTNEAALRDARFCRAAIGEAGCITFHDSQLVYRGIRSFLDDLSNDGAEYQTFFLPHSLFVVEIGPPRLTDSTTFRDAVLGNAEGYLWSLMYNDAYRAFYLRSLRSRVRRVRDRVRTRLSGARG